MRGDRGFTLIEVTLLIAVIGVLAGMLSSSAGDMLQKSRVLRTREDVEKLAQGIASFYADNGFYPRALPGADGRPGGELLGTLMTEAAPPRATESASLWLEARTDLASGHLTRNLVGYRPRTSGAGLGWSGPYVPDLIREDAWGNAYLINVFYLDGRNVVQEPDGTPLGAVWVLSAGPNGTVETPYFQRRDQAAVYGDDIVFRLQ